MSQRCAHDIRYEVNFVLRATSKKKFRLPVVLPRGNLNAIE